jgi:hypothetical protein
MIRKISVIILFILLFLGCDFNDNTTISPTTATFDKNPSSQTDIVVTMSLNGNTLDAVRDGSGDLVLDSDYSVSGSRVTIYKSYLAEQTVGSLKLIFDFSAGNDPALTVTINDTTQTEENYTLNIVVNGTGTTDPMPGTYDYAAGTNISVTAVPANAAAFTGWSGAATGTANPVTVTMDADKTLTASFADDGGDFDESCGSGNPDATVEGSSDNYTATRGSETVYSGGDYRSAIQAALDSLDSGRSSQQRVAVLASGSIGVSSIRLPSHTSFEVCGTMDVGNRQGHGAIEALDATDVSIPYLKMTGAPYFGLRFYGMNGLHLGHIRLELSGGLGIRFERDKAGSSDVTMDDVYVSGTDNHGVETWNIDGLNIGTVVARNTKYCGLLLNNTRNAIIGTVDGDNVATGTGYATFRLANEAGRISDGSYNTNITVDNVKSRGGGRGFFCVSQSGGLRIRNVDLADNGNNAILIENCYNVSIDNGAVNGGGEVRVAARDEFPNTRDVYITLTVNNTSVRESPCGDNVNWNISGNASINVCD